MKTVIIVNGKPRSGKDTAIECMQNMLKVPCTSFSSIDPVRNMLLREGVDISAKTEADRKLLSVIGDALQEHSHMRTNASLYKIGEFFAFGGKNGGVFFLHMREPHLIERMKHACESEGFGFIRVLVTSNRSEDVTSNPSDAGVLDGEYDYTIENNGTLDGLVVTCYRCLRHYDLH